MNNKKRHLGYLFVTFGVLQLGYSNCSPNQKPSADSSSAATETFSKLNATGNRPTGVSPFSSDNELFAQGRILVKARSGVSSDDLTSELDKVGGKSIGKINGLDVHVVQLPENANEKAVAALLAHHPKFEFAEVDQLVHSSGLTNDPYSKYENNIINTADAWTSSNGSGQVIAILDSGVDSSHEDLAASIVPGWNFYDNNSNTSDVNGHGTAVAGSAAAIGNNGIGIAGPAYAAKIMPIRISDLNGWAYWSTLSNGLTYAADRGATVVNASYATACSSTVQSAASYLMNKGGVFVSSAGNDGADIGCGDSSSIVVVSATNGSDTRTSWSNFGTGIDVAAPGEGITVTANGGGYRQANGTSFAAPIVAGVVALMKQANPKLTATQVVSLLKQSADDIGDSGFDIYYGAGRVNAARAVTLAAGSTTATTTTTTTTSTTTTTLAAPPVADAVAPTVQINSPISGSVVKKNVTVSASASDNVSVVSMKIYINGVLKASSSSGSISTTWNTMKVPSGTHTIRVEARDAAGNLGQSSIQVSN